MLLLIPKGGLNVIPINTMIFGNNWRKIKDIPLHILFIYFLVLLGTYVDQRAAYANSIVLESHTERLDDLSDSLNSLLLLASNIKLENGKQDKKLEELETKVNQNDEKTKKQLENHEKRLKSLEDEEKSEPATTPATTTKEGGKKK